MARISPFGGIVCAPYRPQTKGVLAATCVQIMAPRTRTGAIVIVEDPFIRRLVRSVLGRSGLEIIESDAQEAYKLAARAPGFVKLFITNKPDVFEHLEDAVPILYLAASPDWDMASRFKKLRVLQKPFHARELLEAVTEVTNPVK
jgi:DNA-binding response OmpR family regulator